MRQRHSSVLLEIATQGGKVTQDLHRIAPSYCNDLAGVGEQHTGGRECRKNHNHTYCRIRRSGRSKNIWRPLWSHRRTLLSGKTYTAPFEAGTAALCVFSGTPLTKRSGGTSPSWPRPTAPMRYRGFWIAWRMANM